MDFAISSSVSFKAKAFLLSSPAAKPIFSTKSKFKYAVGRIPSINSNTTALAPFDNSKCVFPFFNFICSGILNEKLFLDSF